MLAVRSSMVSLASDWFGLNVITASSLQTADGDILIKLKSKLDLSTGSWKGRPLIILDDGTSTPRKEEAGLYYISQP
jgi:hypothetical protein